MAFAIWGAHLLAARRMEQATLRQMLVPLLLAAALAPTLIFMQPDLGQSVSLSIILLGLLWYAGLPLKLFVSTVSGAVVAAGILAVSAGYRSARVQSYQPDGRCPGLGLSGPAGALRTGQRRIVR